VSESPFAYRNGALWGESVPLEHIASEIGTPCYVYSRAALIAAYREFERAFHGRSHLICYAVKANSSLAILNLFARLGSGFDIVSGGELQRVLKAGGDPGKVVFSGVGKRPDEMRAALEAGLFCFNVESEAELKVLNRVAGEMNKVAPVSLRVNPDVNAQTHPYISTGLKENKFGIPVAQAELLYASFRQFPNIRMTGLDCHIGSQLAELEPFIESSRKMRELLDRLLTRGVRINHLDLGGGLGIRYSDENPPAVQDYVNALCAGIDRRIRIVIEPGRSLVGNAGVLLSRVEYLKHAPHKNFAIVDAAMNDLVRPALYDAYHEILPVQPRKEDNLETYQIVGPVCETGDFIGNDRKLALSEGDLLAIMSTGAYGMSMSSNYNSRARAAEVMIDEDRFQVIRERETVEQLMAGETIPQWPTDRESAETPVPATTEKA
jgi:diaminopimelate decarboxylase